MQTEFFLLKKKRQSKSNYLLSQNNIQRYDFSRRERSDSKMSY